MTFWSLDVKKPSFEENTFQVLLKITVSFLKQAHNSQNKVINGIKIVFSLIEGIKLLRSQNTYKRWTVH